jgi:hypothetical protein
VYFSPVRFEASLAGSRIGVTFGADIWQHYTQSARREKDREPFAISFYLMTRTRVSWIRIAMLTVAVLALLPSTIAFGMYGFTGVLFATLLVALAKG